MKVQRITPFGRRLISLVLAVVLVAGVSVSGLGAAFAADGGEVKTYAQTDALEAGESYIVTVSDGSDVYAVTASDSGSKVSATAVTVADGKISTALTDVVWTFDSDSYLSNANGYLMLGRVSNSSGAYTYTSANALTYADGKLYAAGSKNTYYLTYSSGAFSATSSSSSSSIASVTLYKLDASSGDDPTETPSEDALPKNPPKPRR